MEGLQMSLDRAFVLYDIALQAPKAAFPPTTTAEG